MNITTNGETRQRAPTAADLAASPNGEVLPEVAETNADRPKRPEDLAPLFSGGTTEDFRARWGIVQQGFVDDPRNAVRHGDELVAQVIKSLAETFANQRAALEGEQGSTEGLRVTLRRYRWFFQRLLAI